MHPIRTPALVVASAFLATALATTTAACTTFDNGRAAPPYFDVVNASHDSVTALAIAPAGSDTFEAVDIGKPLRGGVTGMTLNVPPGGCQRDLRVHFSDGRRLLYPGVDLCRHRALRLTSRDMSVAIKPTDTRKDEVTAIAEHPR